MRLAHINVVARNAEALAAFYIDVFGCALLRGPVLLSGDKVSRGNSLPGCEIQSIWLKFPGMDTPFLEIHQHKVTHDRQMPKVNEPGFGHLAFYVDDVSVALARISAAGGSQIGETTNFGSDEVPCLIAYTRDPKEIFWSWSNCPIDENARG